MFSDSAINGPGCWKCSLHIEWHDCSWHPSISLRRGMEIHGAAIKPLPEAAVMPHPVLRQNLAKPMKIIGNRKPETGNLRAFTLIELLTVIAIIGILAAMLLPVLSKVKKSALITKAKTEMADIANAIQSYDADYSRFPITSDSTQPAGPLNEQLAAGTGDFTTGLVWGPGRDNTSSPTGWSVDSNSNVVAILMDLTAYPSGTPTTGVNDKHQKNPKQVKYLNAKMSGYNPADNDPNPPGGVDNSGVYRDPWGNPYIITMDTSYDDQCSDLLYSLQSVSQSSGQTGFNGLFNQVDAGGNGNNFLYHGKVMVWSAGPDGKYDTGAANDTLNKDNILSWQ